MKGMDRKLLIYAVLTGFTNIINNKIAIKRVSDFQNNGPFTFDVSCFYKKSLPFRVFACVVPLDNSSD